MANLKISDLPNTTELLGGELFAIVQGGVTKHATLNQIDNYLIPTPLTVSAGVTVDLTGDPFDDAILIKLSYDSTGGGQQNMTLNLPDATLPLNTNRIIRIISNGGFATNTKVNLTPINGQTLDGVALPYVINKPYEGIQIWSDGIQWFVIQKKG
jgi:hypothetical protein